MKPQETLYELSKAFWKANGYEPFSSAQTALYFFLIDWTDSYNWIMPFKCSTAAISHSLKLSQQSVIIAREELYKRGLIKFIKGHARKEMAQYTIILDPKEWSLNSAKNDNDSNNESLNNDLNKPMDFLKNRVANVEISKTLSDPSNFRFNEDGNKAENKVFGKDTSGELNNGLNNSNNNDLNNHGNNIQNNGNNNSLSNNIKNTANTNFNNPLNNSSSLEVPLGELQNKFLDDPNFINEICVKANSTPENAKAFIQSFFDYQTTQNRTYRDETECRNHFSNWLNKKIVSQSVPINPTSNPN